MSKTIKILIGVLVAIVIIACIAAAAVWLLNRGDDGAAKDPLTGTHWQVRSYLNPAEAGGMASPLAGTQMTAQFADDAPSSDGVLSGSAGCNTYNATYTVDGDSLSISLPAVTMMFCGEPEGTMDQETAYLTALESAAGLSLEGSQLHILNKEGQVVIDYVPYEPLPEATTPPQATEPAGDDSWDRIMAAGKIMVGTAADYPPFESYVAEGQIDGFDIALMDEIGRRLGIEVSYLDFAFDGLGPALGLGQIDAAIAAISRTPEREAVVDFSNVYLVSEDGALAQEGSGIVLDTVDDITQYKVGVQRGSVYQDWLQVVLIDAGRMSPDNMFAYERAEDAVRDLREGRIELVMLDAQAAQAFVNEGGVTLVGKGLNPQNYALALPKGAAALKVKIDEVITSIYNDGTMAGLAQQYLDLPVVPPTPPAAATSTPAPPPACVDGLALVKHLTEEGEMPPGQAFSKGWQVQNTGTCTWKPSYRLVFVSGDRMSGEPVAVTREVQPGETYDVQINLVAPLQPGYQQSNWQMVNDAGTAFGERLHVSVTVVGAPTVTPVPTGTPVPGIVFTVDRNSIKAGECVDFYWKVDNVKEVYFYKEGERWQDHGVTGEGTRRECPPASTTYYLRVVLTDNSVVVQQISIYVEPAADAPLISRFTVDPPGQVALGQCVMVRWEVQGALEKVSLKANETNLWDGAPAAGNYQDCPAAAGSIAYILEATGPGGTSYGQHTINVVDSATPVPTAAPEAPAIHSFSVSPNQVVAGECMGISWSVGGGATYSVIVRNGSVIIDGAGYSGQQMDCLDEPGTYTYRLEAFGATGESVSQEQVGIVTEETPQNPLLGTSWQVMAIYDAEVGGIGMLLPGTSLTAAFGEGGNMNGSAGCNSYSTTYLVEGDQLSITPPTSSSAFCSEPEGIMEQEAAFLSALESARSFGLTDTKLQILNASGNPLLDLQAQP